MQPPAIPADEEFRLAALRSLCLLDTPPEAAFDQIVGLGKALFGVPICLISLVDSDRQWFKAKVGLEASETSRALSFCAHAIHHREAFVVLDTTRDERFHDNPLVAAKPHIRFYAGMPIWLPNGYPVGTICLISPEPRDNFGVDETVQLMALGHLALEAITARALRRELDRESRTRSRFEALLDLSPSPVGFADPEGGLESMNPAFTALAMRFPDVEWLAEEPMRLPAALLSAPELDREGQVPLTLSGAGGTCVLDIYRDVGGYAVIGRN